MRFSEGVPGGFRRNETGRPGRWINNAVSFWGGAGPLGAHTPYLGSRLDGGRTGVAPRVSWMQCKIHKDIALRFMIYKKYQQKSKILYDRDH